MKITHNGRTYDVERQPDDGGVVLDCPCGCGDDAFCYTVAGFKGYFDASKYCVGEVFADAIEQMEEEEAQ